MFCGKCGKENADDVAFCVHCGADLTRQTPPRGKPTPADTVGDMPTRVPGAIYDGKLLAGQYRVEGERPIGSGGMGEVWKAEDTELGTPVAIKVLPPVMARNESAVAGLRREATIGRQLAHRNICRLYGLHSDGDLKFIVMEHVDGKTLAQLLAERPDRKMAWDELEPIARQIAEALDYAHTVSYADASGQRVHAVLHRDIKPGNIMVTDDGVAKLMDFGIAREIHNTMTQLTGRSSQTPLYASPEQFRGEPMTPASDLYSFAAVLYEALAGHPYVSPHGDLRYQILDRPFEPLLDQPETVNVALAAGLSRNLGKRPAKATELIASARTRLKAKPERGQEPELERKRRRRVTWAIAAVALLLVAGSVILNIVLRHRKPSPQEQGIRRVREAKPSDGVEETTPAPTKARYVLAVIADQNAAIKAEVDGSIVDNFVLAKGKFMDWKGRRSVRLELLDPSRVRVYRNGKPITEDLGSMPVTIVYDEKGLAVLKEQDAAGATLPPLTEPPWVLAGIWEPESGVYEATIIDKSREPDKQQIVVREGTTLPEYMITVTEVTADCVRYEIRDEQHNRVVERFLPPDAGRTAGREVAEGQKAALPDPSLANIADDSQRQAVIEAFRKLPTGKWTVEARKVTVAVPEQKTEKRWIAYFKPKGFDMEFVLIRGGTFVMGSPRGEKDRDDDEGPQHEVEISRPFLMSATEVTREQFAGFVRGKGYRTNAEKGDGAYVWTGDGPTKKRRDASWRNPYFSQTDKHPVVCVSWNDARAFCQWLSGQLGLECRLPTEAEWEYACRAGSGTAHSWGEKFQGRWVNFADRNADFSWSDKSLDDGHARTAPAGSYHAGRWGLYDMHGNVWEWCQDWYDANYYDRGESNDPQGPTTGQYRVLRGGSWDDEPRHCRSASRSRGTPGDASNSIGFHIVVSFR